MELKSIFNDDNAVSPVIGVILMVAITVILAAVIGAFVLNIGGSQEKAPQANFGWENTSSGDVFLEHNGGDDIDNATISITISGSGSAADPAYGNPFSSSGSFTAGDRHQVARNADGGNTLKLVWEASSGDSSQVLGEKEV
ncbi:type IV pilin [Haloarchaeobius sp. TZWWS8]|uniref:type IV pilin n=1 Tax=Haloarchaeobius sp. TZWWS8 TaxID=3446121 RepID=UPI003EBE09D6